MDNHKDSIEYSLFYKLNCLSFMYFKIKKHDTMYCTMHAMNYEKKTENMCCYKKIDKKLFEIKIELFP